MCAEYAKKAGLLEHKSWKHLKPHGKSEKKLRRLLNQAKLKSFRTSPRYKYGYEVPRDYNHAVRLDERNNNTKWKDAVDLELKQIDDYNTFEDKGHKSQVGPPSGYKKIRVHLVFDVKHDG